MPGRRYNRRSNYRRRRRTSNVKRNSRAIAKIRKEVYVNRQFQIRDSSTVTQEAVIQPLVAPSTWEPIFQTQGLGGSTIISAYKMNKMLIKWMLQPENTTVGTVDVFAQYFVVSLKPQFRQAFRHELASNNNELEKDVHYSSTYLDTVAGNADGQGMYMLNPQYFRIHYNSRVRRVANQTLMGTDVTNIDNTATTGRANVTWKTMIKPYATKQNFSAITADFVRNDQQLYIIILSNATATAPLFHSMNGLVLGQSTHGI